MTRNRIVPLVAVWLVIACTSAPPPEVDASTAADSGTDASTCAPAGTVPDGRPCPCGTECMPGAVCTPESEIGDPGGICTRVCPDSECSAAAACYADVNRCYAPCTVASDCEGPRICNVSGFCVGYCRSDADCLSGHCDPYVRGCTDGTAPAGAAAMEQCSVHADCRSGFCPDFSAFAGHCIVRCSISAQDCPDGGVCWGDVGTEFGFCSPPCAAGSSCAIAGLTCANVPEPADREACVPSGLVM